MARPTGGLVFAYLKSGEGLRGPYTFTKNRLLAGNGVKDENRSAAFVFGRCQGITITDNHIRFPAGGTLPLLDLAASSAVRAHGNDLVGGGPIVRADDASGNVDVS